jgi:two-component system sensor histidine kinase PilS (NtrC family)
MEGLVRNFLLMARTNLGSRSETDIGRLVEDVIESLTVGAEWNPRVELRKELGKDLRVMGDPAELRQVLWNLMINAIQSMPEGGTLSVTACPNGDNGETRAVRVEIGDTGAGIDPAHIEKIWEPFYTTKERGSGLGLAIVRRIVESHGGDVEVQSEAARGTRFRVRLPRFMREESEGLGADARRESAAAAGR